MIVNSAQENTLVTKNDDINLNDLAVALLVYYEKSIECKNISFSLDPAVPSNPEGPFQKKVVWPDKEENKSLIAGTEFAEIMFEADWIMKQLSLGIKVDSMNPLQTKEMPYHPQLSAGGLGPSSTFRDLSKIQAGQSAHDWNRLWIVVKNVDVKTINDN